MSEPTAEAREFAASELRKMANDFGVQEQNAIDEIRSLQMRRDSFETCRQWCEARAAALTKGPPNAH